MYYKKCSRCEEVIERIYDCKKVICFTCKENRMRLYTKKNLEIKKMKRLKRIEAQKLSTPTHLQAQSNLLL